MFTINDFNKSTYRIGEVAKMLGLTTQTVRKYADEGKIKTWRADEKGNRRVLKCDLIDFVDSLGLFDKETNKEYVSILYFSSNVNNSTRCKKVRKCLERMTSKRYVIIYDSEKIISLSAVRSLIKSDSVDRVYVYYDSRDLGEYKELASICMLNNIKLTIVK